jgi:Adenylate cyclase, family 3 (some proteins contain HAMP domain)
MTSADPAPATPPLPVGTVTFLFTDIVGSTTLWEAQRDAMRISLARHDVLLRRCIEHHGGYVVKTTGDGFHAAFGNASDAIEAAIAGQKAMHAEPWSEAAPIRVRMALHTGAAELRDRDYYGPTVNRAARLAALGHGGQTLLSQVSHDLCREA